MAYVGRSPRYGFLEGQTLTFDGSTTTVTLQRNVSSTDALDVYIDNVHQEPDVAYNLASGGNQITFTGTPANGQKLYIRFHGISFDTARASKLVNTDESSSLTLTDSHTLTLDLNGTTALTATTSGITIPNLTVTGTTTSVNSTNLEVGDNQITLNSDVDGSTAPTQDAGIVINRGSSADVSFLWDEGADYWAAGEAIVSATRLSVLKSGTTPSLSSSTLGVFKNSAANQDAAISIIANSGQSSAVNFGDENDEDVGKLSYSHTSDSFTINKALAITGTTQVDRLGSNTSPNANYAISALQNGSMTHAGYFQANGDDIGIEVKATASGSYSSDVLFVQQSSRNSGGNLARFANSDGDKFVVATDGTATFSGSVTAAGVTVGNSNLGSNSSHLANITLNNNGYIGSANANTALQIQTSGNAVFSGSVTASGDFLTSTSLKVAGHPVVSYATISGGYAARLGSTGTSTLNETHIYRGGSFAAAFTGTGLGINYDSPKEKLHVLGAAVFDGNHATATNAYRADEGVMIHGASHVGYITAVSNGNNDVDLQLRALNGGGANSNQLVLDSNGFVGINTTAAPVRTLDVKGSVNFSVNTSTHETFVFTTAAANDAKLMMQNASSATTVQLQANGDSYFNGGHLGLGAAPDTTGYGGTFQYLGVNGGSGYGVFDGQTSSTTAGDGAASFFASTTGSSGYKILGGMRIINGAHSSSNAEGELELWTSTGGSVYKRMTIDRHGATEFLGNVKASDIIAKNSDGVSLQSDEGTKRLIVEDSGHVKMGEGPINTAVDTNGVISNTSNAYSWSTKNVATSGSIYGNLVHFTAQDPNNTTSRFFAGVSSAGTRYAVYSNGNVENSYNSYGSISDKKLKENIVDAGSQWGDIKALPVRKYSMKEEEASSPTQIGVIAQEVEDAGMSGLVYETDDRDIDTGEITGSTKAVKYSVLYMKAVKALQEAMTRIEILESKVAELEQ